MRNCIPICVWLLKTRMLFHGECRRGRLALLLEYEVVCNFHDWEMEGVDSLMDFLYAKLPFAGGTYWVWNSNGEFSFQSMNIWEMLAGKPFPWRCLCSINVPKKVPSLVCAAMLNKNLIIGNLVKGVLPLINWCCVCKASNESVGHLLLHCAVAHSYSYFFSRLLGVAVDDGPKIIDIYCCWKGLYGRLRNSLTWNVTLCVLCGWFGTSGIVEYLRLLRNPYRAKL